MATLPNPLPRLATDPSGRSLGLHLPPGRLVDATAEGPWPEPLLWHAEKPAAPGTWKALGAPAARVGLLSVLVDAGGRDSVPQEGPGSWELMPELASYPGDHDAEDVLADYWGYWEAEDAEAMGKVVEPFGAAWPGLAPAPTPTADPGTRAAQVADLVTGDGAGWFDAARLALVPARRSADIPAAIGWSGPLNHDNDVARLCAVLRSWEDRFGIRVVGLGFDTLLVSVAAPPATQEVAEAVAAEHFAFCPDNITQGRASGLRDYAKGLVGAHLWTFWWD
ncbi:DUF4253 domain-containing protein [Streptomyces sp. AF1A]|jgi:hypothetical protein|uniref:DUF4253 domain-containing protein n=1 Tax=Streptomyces sp. AF1A TaxID=3394350 RepID=UPI0039BD66F2